MPNLISYYDSPTTTAINQPLKQLTWVDTIGVTIDCSAGNAFKLRVNGTSGTIAMSNVPTSSRYGFELHLNWVAGSITWPISWNKGDALPTTPGGYVVTGVSVDDGNSFKIAVIAEGLDIITDGLVLNLDAGNYDSYPGSGTTWTDLAGSNDGTLTNGPTYSGANGGSIVFDGTDDRISLPNISTTSSFTFEAWINTDNRTRIRQYIYTKQRQPPSGYSYTFQQMQGIYLSYGNPTASTNCTLIVNFASNDGSGTLFYIDENIISNNNTWYHLAATMDNGTVAMYVNGIEYTALQWIISLYSATTTPGIFTPNDCKVGGRYDAEGNDPFDGKIAIVRDYNRALSAAEVKQNFEATRGRFGI